MPPYHREIEISVGIEILTYAGYESKHVDHKALVSTYKNGSW